MIFKPYFSLNINKKCYTHIQVKAYHFQAKENSIYAKSSNSKLKFELVARAPGMENPFFLLSLGREWKVFREHVVHMETLINKNKILIFFSVFVTYPTGWARSWPFPMFLGLLGFLVWFWMIVCTRLKKSHSKLSVSSLYTWKWNKAEQNGQQHSRTELRITKNGKAERLQQKWFLLPTSSELICSLKILIRSDSTVTAVKAGSSSSLPLTCKMRHFKSLLTSWGKWLTGREIFSLLVTQSFLDERWSSEQT